MYINDSNIEGLDNWLDENHDEHLTHNMNDTPDDTGERNSDSGSDAGGDAGDNMNDDTGRDINNDVSGDAGNTDRDIGRKTDDGNDGDGNSNSDTGDDTGGINTDNQEEQEAKNKQAEEIVTGRAKSLFGKGKLAAISNPMRTFFLYVPLFVIVIIGIVTLFGTSSICDVSLGDLIGGTIPSLTVKVNSKSTDNILNDLYTDGSDIVFDVSGRIYFWGPEPSQHNAGDAECEFQLNEEKIEILNLTNGNTGSPCYMGRGVSLYMTFIDANTNSPVSPNIYYQTAGLRKSYRTNEDGSQSIIINAHIQEDEEDGRCENPMAYTVKCFDDKKHEDKRMFTFSFNSLHSSYKIPKGAKIKFKIASFQQITDDSFFQDADSDSVKMPNASGEYKIYIKGGLIDEYGAKKVAEREETNKQHANGIVTKFEHFIYGNIAGLTLKSAHENTGFIMTAYRQITHSSLVRVIRLMMMLSMIILGFSIMLGLGSFKADEIIIWILKLAVCVALSSSSNSSTLFFYRFIVYFSKVILDVVSTLANNIFVAFSGSGIFQESSLTSSIKDMNIAQYGASWLREIDIMFNVILSDYTIAKIGILLVGHFPLGFIISYAVIGMAFKIITFCIKVIMMYGSVVIQLGLLIMLTPFVIPFILFKSTSSYVSNWIGKIEGLYYETCVIVLMSKIVVNVMLSLYVGILDNVQCPEWMRIFSFGSIIGNLFLFGVIASFLALAPTFVIIIMVPLGILTSGTGLINWAQGETPILDVLKAYLLVMVFSSAYDKLIQIGSQMVGGESAAAATTTKAMNSASEIKNMGQKHFNEGMQHRV